MTLIETELAQETRRLVEIARTPKGRARRRLTRIVVRAMRVIVGIGLIITVVTFIAFRQSMPESSSRDNAAADLPMGPITVAMAGGALVAGWFIALGRGPTHAEKFERLHTRAQRTIVWRKRMALLPGHYRRLTSPRGLLTRVVPALSVVLAIAWIYTPGKRPTSAGPEIIATTAPALRLTRALLAGERPSLVARDQEMVAAQNTPLFLRLDNKLRASQR